MPYKGLDDAIALANRGMGSLALSLFTFDNKVAEEFVLGSGAYHGRMMILDRTSAKESTGHGSPLPVLVHGGPGRAGGGAEMGRSEAHTSELKSLMRISYACICLKKKTQHK